MSTPISPSRCGTPAGFARHQRNDEQPCDACTKAKADYDRRRRDAGENQIRNRLCAKAQGRAEQLLRRRYPDEYDELYRKAKAQVFAEAGLDRTWDSVRTGGNL